MARRGCLNFNHGRPEPPVRVCPSCDETVNVRIPEKQCTEREHNRMKRNRNVWVARH